jgi:hypothetical protein
MVSLLRVFCTDNVIGTYYMQNRACSKFLSSWQQCILAGHCTDPPFNTALPYWRDMNKKSVQSLPLQSNINIIVARSTATDVVAVVKRLRRGD